MADKEPRKRKKRRESQKREENEEVSAPKEKAQHDIRQPSEETSSHDVGHEPSIFAKSVFFLLFSLLIVAVGVIFFTLHGVQPIPWESTQEPSIAVLSEEPSEPVEHFVITDEQDPRIEEQNDNNIPEESPPLDPSEMHPWSEHLPPEKTEEQNIFSQLYDALGEEFFQDEDDDEDHDDDDDDDHDGDNEHNEALDDDKVQIEASDDNKFVDEVQHEHEKNTEEKKVDLTENDDDDDDIQDQDNYPSETELGEESPIIDSELEDEDEEEDTEDDIPSSSDSIEVLLEDVEFPAVHPVLEHSSEARIEVGETLQSDSEEVFPRTYEKSDVEKDSIQEDSRKAESVLETEPMISTEEKDLVEDSKVVDAATPVLVDESFEDDDFWDLPLEVSEFPESAFSSIEPTFEGKDNPSEVLQPVESSLGDTQNSEDLPIKDAEEEDDTLQETNGPFEEKIVELLSNPPHDSEPEESDKNVQSEDQPYENADVTNEYDFLFKEDIDEADRIVEKSPESALKIFESLATKHPQSPRVIFGIAKALDKLAEVLRKNSYLDDAIESYKKVLTLPNVPKTLYIKVGKQCVERMRFRGYVGKALSLQSDLSAKFPEDLEIQNQLAVSFLWMGKNQQAKDVLNKVLAQSPGNGFAKVHLGFILKVEEGKHQEAIPLLRDGLSSREPGVIDGRFYFHLGDALSRIGNITQAMEVYEEGVREGVFLSAYQRSLYNVDTLTGKPWWKPQDTPYHSQMQMLEKSWSTIRNEALALMDDSRTGFKPESEDLTDTGIWKQFELFSRGRKIVQNCQRAPQTCSLFEKIPDASGCKRGQVKFSVMHPGTHVWAHTGPTNCRLRAHLGLVVPQGPRIRVANESRNWIEGKIIIFDDSFEHEVWHDGKSFRLILIADFWHPELTPEQKATLSPI